MKLELEITEEQKDILVIALEDASEKYYKQYRLSEEDNFEDWKKENKKLFKETENMLKQIEVGNKNEDNTK